MIQCCTLENVQWGRSYVKCYAHQKRKGHMKSFGDDRIVYFLGCGDSITGVCICPTHQNVYIKCLQFLYINHTLIKLKKMKWYYCKVIMFYVKSSILTLSNFGNPKIYTIIITGTINIAMKRQSLSGWMWKLEPVLSKRDKLFCIKTQISWK